LKRRRKNKNQEQKKGGVESSQGGFRPRLLSSQIWPRRQEV